MQEGKFDDILCASNMGIAECERVVWGRDIVGIGLDRCEVPRIRRNIEEIDTFIIRYFSDPEIVYCEQADSPLLKAQRYAARLAAKEAVTKALGIDGRAVDFRDIIVLKERSGKPFIFLDGRVKDIADRLGVTRVFLSIAHEKDAAVAFCVAVRGLDIPGSG